MFGLTLRVLKRIKAASPGAALTPKAFGDLGNRATGDQALSRSTKAGRIRRISRGVCDIPKTHPTLGPLSPDPDVVARVIAAGYRPNAGGHGKRAWSLFTGTCTGRLFD